MGNLPNEVSVYEHFFDHHVSFCLRSHDEMSYEGVNDLVLPSLMITPHLRLGATPQNFNFISLLVFNPKWQWGVTIVFPTHKHKAKYHKIY